MLVLKVDERVRHILRELEQLRLANLRILGRVKGIVPPPVRLAHLLLLAQHLLDLFVDLGLAHFAHPARVLPQQPRHRHHVLLLHVFLVRSRRVPHVLGVDAQRRRHLAVELVQEGVLDELLLLLVRLRLWLRLRLRLRVPVLRPVEHNIHGVTTQHWHLVRVVDNSPLAVRGGAAVL